MIMQIKNNFITSDENAKKHYIMIFNWCFIEFQSHSPDPNEVLWLAYNVVNS